MANFQESWKGVPSNTGKLLSDLLAPLILNQYSVKDSFEAAQRIHNIPTEYFDQDHVFVSFDVESLFIGFLSQNRF